MAVGCRGQVGGRPFVVNRSDRALTLAVGREEVVAWDHGGRLYSIWRDGRTCRRGLSGRAFQKWQDRAGRHRESLTAARLDALVTYAADLAAATGEAVEASARRHAGSSDFGPLEVVLARAAAFDATAAREDAARFSGIYGEVGILPPDQYLSLVVQTTEGCAYATCTFCDLYRRPFRVRSDEAFAQHLVDVRTYLGESLGLRGRAVFLGAANALSLPVAQLVRRLDAIAETFGADRPVYGFVDALAGARKPSSDYSRLHEHGLRRVYVGLESGHDPLLRLVRKPSTREGAVETVRSSKDGGLEVGVMVIVGLGGDRFGDAHVADTIEALNAMALGPSDVIYFSDLVESAEGDYAASVKEQGARPLSWAERRAQRRAIEAGLRFRHGRPKLAVYDLGEFVY